MFHSVRTLFHLFLLFFSAKGLEVPRGMIIGDDLEGTLRRFLVARKYDMVRKYCY
jgi:hypothetical protein